MEQVSTREMLQELADSPIGSQALQAEADRIAHQQGISGASGELKDTIKRVSKKWLPLGKLAPRPRGTCNEPAALQTDIEDAVETAGGRRGGQ